MGEEEKELYMARSINSSDLQAIGHVLAIYAQGVSSITILASKHDAYLYRIDVLRERIATMQAVAVTDAEQYFPLTHAELDLIDCAFTTFVDTIGSCVPPSAERDEVMRGCKALQAHILSGAPPPD